MEEPDSFSPPSFCKMPQLSDCLLKYLKKSEGYATMVLGGREKFNSERLAPLFASPDAEHTVQQNHLL